MAERLSDTVSRLICRVLTPKAFYGNSSAYVSRWVSLEVKCQQACGRQLFPQVNWFSTTTHLTMSWSQCPVTLVSSCLLIASGWGCERVPVLIPIFYSYWSLDPRCANPLGKEISSLASANDAALIRDTQLPSADGSCAFTSTIKLFIPRGLNWPWRQWL